MEKLYSIIAGLFITASVFAQAPQKMSYQAVIRNNANALITSTAVGMKISVLQGSSNGTVVYSETQTPNTNANGLVSLQIGSGTPLTGTFAGINWANGPYFIKTETDPNGGSSYTIAGTNELLSVPYALFSVNGTPGPAGPAGPAGATGAQGPIGATGPQGGIGLTGATGAQGPIGLTGPAGATGPIGMTGATGATGSQGPIGATGPQGATGLTGAIGAQGPAGAQGPIGLTGATGPAGPVGATGAQGPQGNPGILLNGTVAGNTPYWDGTSWLVNSNNIFNNGANVGIGNSFPGAKLDVKTTDISGLTARFNAPDKTYLGLYEADTYRGYVGSYYGNAQDVDLGSSIGAVHLVTGSTIDLTAKAGDIGIGTTDPTAKLEVKNAANGQTLKINAADETFMGIWENNAYRGYVGSFYGNIADVDLGSLAGAVHLVTGSSIDLTAKAGKIGIGTENPGQLLDIYNPSGAAFVRIMSDNQGNSGVDFVKNDGGTNWRLKNDNSTGYFTLESQANNTLLTAPTPRFEWYTTHFSPSQNNIYELGTGFNRWSTVYATNGIINTSDARDKTNIANLNYGLNEVMKLRPVSFNWRDKEDEGTKVGLIAQELQQILPEVVRDWAYRVDESSDKKVKVPADRLGVFYSDLIPVLIKATQEQQQIIQAMQQQIDELKRLVGELNKK